MILVEATGLQGLAHRWYASVKTSMLNARLNPGSPIFPHAVSHLQEALAMLAHIYPLTAVAALCALGVLVTPARSGFR